MKYFVFVTALVHFICGKLKIIEPQALVSQFQNNGEIKYSASNFGNIPWGRRLSGYLEIASPVEACNDLNYSSKSQFVLIKRGNCTFVTKVRNAQNAGFQFAIIEDDREEIIDNMTMSDDGTGYSIQIPSVFISKKDGDKLSKYFNNTKNGEVQQVQLLMKFDVRQQEKIDVIFALSIVQGDTYKFLREYYPFYKDLEDQKINYTIMYPLYTIQSAKPIEYDNCISYGKYCAYDPDGTGTANGVMIVQETLRQLCIFNLDQNKWFQYMVYNNIIQESFRDNCTTAQMYEDCSEQVQQEVGIDTQKVEKCKLNQSVKANFTFKSITYSYLENSLLDNQLRLWNVAGIQSIPGIVINHQDYLGKVTASGVYVDICNSFATTPEQCGNYVDGYIFQSNSSTNLYLTIGIIIGVMIAFFILIFFVYTKLVRKEFKESSQTQVNDMVAHYIQFYESKDKKNKEAI